MATKKYTVQQIETLGIKCKFHSMGAERDGWIMPDGSGVDYAGYAQLSFEPETISTSNPDGLIRSRVAAAEVSFSGTEFGYTCTEVEGWMEQQDVLVRRCYATIDQQRVTLVFRVRFKPGSAGWISASLFNMSDALASDVGWKPSYSQWRHGGFYVTNIQDPNGATGCVSNAYGDGKWRIVCDPRRCALNEPGDHTFDSRDAAALAERGLVRQQALYLQASLDGHSVVDAGALTTSQIAAA